MSKKYVVAGGFGILGGAVCKALEERGHVAAVIDLAPIPEGHPTPAEGGVDLTDETRVATAYAALAEKMGGIDGIVNVAGGFLWEMLADGSLDSWDRMYRMNVRTAVVSSRAALPYLFEGGAIVNVGAAAATNVAAGMAPYASSKAGVMAFTESLADELRGRGIRVNAVLPTILDTPANRQEMPDADTSAWVNPAAAARVIAFLLSEESACVTGGGIKLSISG